MNQFSFNEMFRHALTDDKVQQALHAFFTNNPASTAPRAVEEAEPLLAPQVTLEPPTDDKRLQREVERLTKKLEKLEKEKQVNTLTFTEKFALNDEITKQKRTIQHYEQQIMKLEQELKQATAKLAPMKEIEQKLQQAEAQIVSEQLAREQQKTLAVSAQLAPFEEAYSHYITLSNDARHALRGIFKDDTLTSFIFCGVQEQNISPLWEAIKREVINGNVDELESLNVIFDFCLHASNAMYNEPLYARNVTQLNVSLDEDVHIRTATSTIHGNVTAVHWEGYYNTKTARIVKKTVVHV